MKLFRTLLITGACLLLSTGLLPAQGVPKHYLSTVSTNATLVYGARANVSAIMGFNTNATVYFLKIYDKATAPTCGTDTPVLTVPLPQNTGNGVQLGQGLQFANGVGFCITGAIADNDTSNAATGIAVDFGVSGR